MNDLSSDISGGHVFTTKKDEALIRCYQHADRESVRQLCCDNGYLGDPIDGAFSDRDLYASIFIDPYLDHYPEWTFVAEYEGQIVGYLTAATGFRYCGQQALSGSLALCRLVATCIFQENTASLKDKKFLTWLFFRSWRERVHRPSTAVHMHFGVQAAYRGRFVAQRLWMTFERELQLHDIDHYYGEIITIRPQQVARVYQRFGLKLYDQKLSTMFAHVDPRPVWAMCIMR